MMKGLGLQEKRRDDWPRLSKKFSSRYFFNRLGMEPDSSTLVAVSDLLSKRLETARRTHFASEDQYANAENAENTSNESNESGVVHAYLWTAAEKIRLESKGYSSQIFLVGVVLCLCAASFRARLVIGQVHDSRANLV